MVKNLFSTMNSKSTINCRPKGVQNHESIRSVKSGRMGPNQAAKTYDVPRTILKDHLSNRVKHEKNSDPYLPQLRMKLSWKTSGNTARQRDTSLFHCPGDIDKFDKQREKLGALLQ